MARFGRSPEGLVPFTAEEEAEADAREAKFEADKPMVAWIADMAASDVLIPRWGEDLYDSLSLEIRDGISVVTKNKIVQKKAKRALRPS
jgi:hypothetical protein|tara:strand:- start:32 stop:298 length:267 start_codon:yes stop_codon:yes gene_type:complete